MPELPTLTGRQLYRLLIADGWEVRRRSNHGMFLTKRFENRTRTTVVKVTSRDIPNGTLSAILSERQTGLGRDGLLRLIERHGL